MSALPVHGVADDLRDMSATVRDAASTAHYATGHFDNDPLSPPEVVQGWVHGLQAAGATKVKTAWLHRLSLPRVVEFDCPFFHDGVIVGTFARVRLLVDRTGWVSHYEGLRLGDEGPKFNTASCAGCSQTEPERFWVWLLDCPKCSDESAEDHPKHGWFDADPEVVDESVIGFVLNQFESISQGEDASPAPRTSWTAESAAEWLDEQTDSDGQAISPEMGQKPVWQIVRDIKGHPPQAMVREAQAMRKGRS